MDPASSNWRNAPAVKSEVWGNVSSDLGSISSGTGSFAQNSDRKTGGLGNPSLAWNSTGAKVSAGANSSAMWPSSDVSAKQDINKWGIGLSGGNGGSGQSNQNDSESWRSSSGNSWSSAEKNDISGWGSPTHSPVPNAGTEGWGSKMPPQADDRVPGWSSDSRSNNGYLQQDGRQGSGSWGSESSSDRSKQSQWGTAGSGAVPGFASGAWSRGNPIMQPSQSVPNMGNPQPQSTGAPGSWAQAVTNKSGQSGGGSGNTGTGSVVQEDAKPSNVRRSHEELIAQAINSNEGWGKTTIRQDTAWLIEDIAAEQRKASGAPEPSGASAGGGVQSEETAAHLARQTLTGTAIWESSKTAAASRILEKSAEERSSAWSGTPVEKSGGIAVSPANGPNPVLAVGNNPSSAFRPPPLDKPPSTNSWPPGQTEKTSGGWGTGSTSSEGSWEGAKKEDDRLWDLDSNKGSKTETGVWERSLRRNSSSGSWTGDEVENVGGWGEDKTGHAAEVDDGTSVWGDPNSQNRPPQNWKHGSKPSSGGPSQHLGQRMRPDERGDGFFVVPSPSIGLKSGAFGDQMEGGPVGPWNPSVPPPKPEGGWGDGHWPGVGGQRPPKSSSMSGGWDINDWISGSTNRRNDFAISGIGGGGGVGGAGGGGGGKGPTPQRSVVLQQLLNMGFRKEDAQNALISNNMNVDNAITELLNTRLRGDPEVSDLQRNRLLRPGDDLTSDNSLDANNILFGLPQLNNSSFSMGGGGGNAPPQALANQLRPVGPTSLQQFGSSLGSQSSVLPDFTSLLQRTNQVMNNSVLTPPQQQKQLMQQLLQSVQNAVQLGLLPAQLVKPQTLMNPNFVVNVQRLLQLYEMHQKLNEQCQLVQRQHQGSVLTSTVQQHLLELTLTNISIQQQVDQLKQQILQMAATPAASAPAASVGGGQQVDQLLKGLQFKDDGTAASRLLSQWKIDNDNSGALDAKPPQHSVGLDMPITDPTWLPMSSSASSWSGSSADDSTMAGANADNKGSSGIGAVPQTSTLSSSTTAASDSSSTTGANVTASNTAPSSSAALEIEEFVPGKPWQGPSTKNVEDDPYITPGSVSRNSISTVNDVQVMNILGKNNSSGHSSGPAPTSAGSTGSLGKVGSSQSLHSPAAAAGLSSAWLNEPPPSLSVDPWGRNNPALPPGLNIQNKPPWHYNRSISWAPGDRSDYASMMNNWSGANAPSNWLILKNLAPQVDNVTLQAFCVQHGPVLRFLPNVLRGQAIVGYAKIEDAIKAQRNLHSCKFGNTQLIAEFINEADVAQIIEANGRGLLQQMPNNFARPPLPSLGSAYSSLHPATGQLSRPELAAPWNATGGLGGSSWSGAGSGNSWGLSLEEHGGYLPGDLLGGQ